MAEPVEELSKVKNPAGVYKHPDTGAEVIARRHPKFGNAMADGLARVGFVFDRPAPSKTEELEEKARVDQPEAPVNTNDKKEGKK